MNERTTIHNGAPDRFVMLSGGMDSVATAYHLIEEKWSKDYGPWNKRPVVVYCDTTIGLTAQRIYAYLVADYFDWQLWSLRTHEDFESHTEEEGFYGNQQHDKMFKRLKGRQMSKLATVSGNPHFYFGTRRAESKQREKIEEIAWDDGKRATVHNVIFDWSDAEVVDYLRGNDVPFNPNWLAAHFTDCGCGATAAREELIELEAEGYEVMARKLRDLESRVTTGDKREWWGWGSWNPAERMHKDAEANPDQTQLSDLMCGPDCSRSKLAAATDGGTGDEEEYTDPEAIGFGFGEEVRSE